MPSAERSRSTVVLRASLAAVWLATAVVSAVEVEGQAAALLKQAGWSDPFWIRGVILAGAGVDLLIGLGLAWRPGRAVYLGALAMMGIMTIAATVLLPSLWLHPLGPLTKNVPLVAILWTLLHVEGRH